MATELLGIAGMTDEMKQFYDRKLLQVSKTDVVYMNWGQKRPIPPRWGKSIEFRRFERITITAGSYTLTEGTPPTETQATISTVTATISQFGQFSYISDLLETQSYDPIIAEYIEAYGRAMAEGMDVVVRNDLSSATNIQYADIAHQVGTSGTGSVGSGNYLDAAELLEAKRTLARNGARSHPQAGGDYVCLIHPDNTKDLFEDPDIVDSFQNAGERSRETNPMFSGVIGRWMGIKFVETNNLRVRSSYGMSGADVYETFLFGDGFYGVTELSAHSARTIIHPRGPSGGHSDPLEQYSTIGWKSALATAILNNNFGVLINCASSRTNAA